MKTMQYTWWKDKEFFIGFWNAYPDYTTQGYSKEELIENLKSLLEDIDSGEIPGIRTTEEIQVA